jgi:hypothetical protein
MAIYGEKYYYHFKDENETSYRVSIQPKYYGGTSLDLSNHVGPLPFIISIPVKSKTNTMHPTGARFQIYSNGTSFRDLYTVDPLGVRVILSHYSAGVYRTKWTGYLSVESYTEPFDSDDVLLEFTCNDGLDALDRIKYFPEVGNPLTKGLGTIRSVLLNCFTHLDYSNVFVVNTLMEQHETLAYNLFSRLVDLSRYIDEDGESKTLYWVLENTLKSLGLCYQKSGPYIFIYMPGALNVSGPLTYYVFSSSLYYSSTETMYNYIDKASAHFDFLEAKQSLSIKSGFNEIVHNYNPYPHGLFFFDDLDLADWENQGPEQVSNDTFIGWWDDDDAEINEILATNGITLHRLAEDSNMNRGAYVQMMGNSEATKGDKALAVYWPTPDGNLCVIDINSGYVWADGENLGYKFSFKYADGKYLDDYSIEHTDKKITSVKFKLSVKIGSKWGVLQTGSDFIFNMTSDTEVVNTITITNNNDTVLGEDLDIILRLRNINQSGLSELKIYDYFIAYDEDDVVQYASGYGYLLFWDFEALPGELEVNKKAIETIGKTDIDYINSDKVKVIFGDKRTGGSLDRGMLWVNSTTPTSQWFLLGETTYLSLAEMMLRFYLSQYTNPYLQLTCKITGCAMYPHLNASLNYALTPLCVLMDSTNLPGKKLLVAGGEYNVAAGEFDGIFEELNQITENIL